MGRKRVELTEQQLNERRERYWGEDYNKRRRARYQADAEYRRTAIQQVRESYRQAQEAKGLSVRADDCRANIPRLGVDLGAVRRIEFPDGGTLETMTLTMEELAEALDRNVQVLYRWHKAGLFPRPGFEARNEFNRLQPVFGLDEARALLEVFGDHQQRSQYLRTFHEDTVEALHKASYEERRKLKGQARYDGTGSTNHPPADKAAAPAAATA